MENRINATSLSQMVQMSNCKQVDNVLKYEEIMEVVNLSQSIGSYSSGMKIDNKSNDDYHTSKEIVCASTNSTSYLSEYGDDKTSTESQFINLFSINDDNNDTYEELNDDSIDLLNDEMIKINQFFEQSDIFEDLICPWCKNRFNIPKNLPCGEVICESCCTLKIEIIDKKFKCPSCNELHDAPKDSIFPTNKIALKMLTKKPKELFRGSKVESLKQKLSELKIKTKDFENMFHEKNSLIEHCKNVKTEVNLATRLLIEKINDFNKELIDNIDTFEKECLEGYEKQNKEKKIEIKIEKKLNSVKMFQNKCRKYLNQVQIEEEMIESSINRTNILIEKHCKIINDLNFIFFNGKKISFVKNPCQIYQNIIGTIRFDSIDFSHSGNTKNNSKTSKIQISSAYICSKCGNIFNKKDLKNIVKKLEKQNENLEEITIDSKFIIQNSNTQVISTDNRSNSFLNNSRNQSTYTNKKSKKKYK